MINRISNKIINEQIKEKNTTIYLIIASLLFLLLTKQYIEIGILESISSILSHYIYNPLFFLPVSFFISMKVINLILENNNLITRIKNTKTMQKLIIVSTLKATAINYLVLIMLLFIVENIFNISGYGYSNENLYQLIMIITKNLFIFEILNIIFSLLYYKISRIISVIFCFVNVSITAFCDFHILGFIGTNLITKSVDLNFFINLIINLIIFVVITRLKRKENYEKYN
ncbi:MAG: hypothetical protein RSE48_01725 [Bacilli bacterium]